MYATDLMTWKKILWSSTHRLRDLSSVLREPRLLPQQPRVPGDERAHRPGRRAFHRARGIAQELARLARDLLRVGVGGRSRFRFRGVGGSGPGASVWIFRKRLDPRARGFEAARRRRRVDAPGRLRARARDLHRRGLVHGIDPVLARVAVVVVVVVVVVVSVLVSLVFSSLDVVVTGSHTTAFAW